MIETGRCVCEWRRKEPWSLAEWVHHGREGGRRRLRAGMRTHLRSISHAASLLGQVTRRWRFRRRWGGFERPICPSRRIHPPVCSVRGIAHLCVYERNCRRWRDGVKVSVSMERKWTTAGKTTCETGQPYINGSDMEMSLCLRKSIQKVEVDPKPQQTGL